MHNNTPVRSSGFIWGVRIVQAIFALTLLGIAAENASVWHNLGCDTPSKLAYHIAMAAITLFPLAYFLLSTGPVSLTRFWTAWVQIALDLLFVIFWIVAAALSTYDCQGLCSSCSAAGARLDVGDGFVVWVGSLVCTCVFADDSGGSSRRRRTALLARAGASGVKTVAEKASSIAAKKGLDAALIFLFLVTLFTALYLKYGSSAARAQKAASADAGREETKIGDESYSSPPAQGNPQNASTTGV